MKLYMEDVAEALLLGLIALSVSTIGCGSDDGSTSSSTENLIADFCEKSEDCSGKNRDQCLAEVEDQQRDADREGCSGTFEAIVRCLDDAECVSGTLHADCEEEMGDHAYCLNEADPNT